MPNAEDGNSTQEERNIISALKGKVLTIDTESEDQSKQISKENELGQGNHVQKWYAEVNFRDKGVIRKCVSTETLRIGPEL